MSEKQVSVVNGSRKRVRPTLSQVRCLEAKIAELSGRCEELEYEVYSYRSRIDQLMSRVFWSRVFNRV